MESKYIKYFCAACIACTMAACSDDDRSDVVAPTEGGENGGSQTTEQSVMTLNISQASPNTYAYVGTDPATGVETKITGDVDVYIFDDAGYFEDHKTLNVSGSGTTYTTDTFSVNAGTKWFYVYANMNGVIATPAAGTTRGTFETAVLNNTVTAMTTPDNFYMGTLTGVKQDVSGNGTEDNPDHVNISIGRLSAKITLKNNSNLNASGELQGTFDVAGAEYRIVVEPAQSLGYYQVLQTNGTLGTDGTQVFTPYYYTAYSQSNYTMQTTWGNPETAIGTPLYTYENTNQVPRWGSATSVEVRYKYQPDAAEVYDAEDPMEQGSLSGSTFWMAIYPNGMRLIIDADGPAVHPTWGTPEEIVEYTDGFSYYVIPITDDRETEVSAKYSVIRNHSYQLTVNSISRLGNSEPGDIDPPTEIERDVWIDIVIEVLDWFLVNQGVDL